MASIAHRSAIDFGPGFSRALRQAVQSWDGLLEWLPIGIYTCDAKGYLLNHNRRAAELWGQNPDPSERQRYCGCYKALRADGTELPSSETPMAELLATRRPIRDREMDIERPDGTRLTLLVNLEPLFDDEGDFAGGVSCIQDITARTLAEQRLKDREQWYGDLLQALPAAIYTTDAEGRVTFYNQAAEELAGRKPKLGSDEWCVTWKLYSADGTPVAHKDCPMATALKTGEPVRGSEKVAERPDGTRIPILPYPTPLRDGDGKMIGAVNMLVDVSERKEAEEQKSVLLRELAHRVNNSFALILAMTHQSLRTASSPEAFAEAFSGRLQALAQAHNLLLAKDWSGAELGELVQGQLAPFCSGAAERLTLGGPEVMLNPAQVIALGVVLHELGANAAKYGALSGAHGHVALSWRRSGGRVHLSWRESGGPAVTPPSHKGLGSKLIERGIPDATIDWRFEPGGVVCAIALPLDERVTKSPSARMPARGQMAKQTAGAR
jgi:PAS domain S-box-containing protein